MAGPPLELPPGGGVLPELLPPELPVLAGVVDPLLEDPPVVDELVPEDELPPPTAPPFPFPVSPPELLDELPPPDGLLSNPDDDPLADGLPTDWLAGWELHALQTPAPSTTNRPARCEWAN